MEKPQNDYESLLLLFIRGKLGTCKNDCLDKISKKPGLLTFLSGNRICQLVALNIFSILIKIFEITMKWFCSFLLCYNNFYTKTNTGNKIK